MASKEELLGRVKSNRCGSCTHYRGNLDAKEHCYLGEDIWQYVTTWQSDIKRCPKWEHVGEVLTRLERVSGR